MNKLFVTLMACAGLFGCVEAVSVPTASAEEVVVSSPVEVEANFLPPVAIVEVITVRPSVNHYWVGGYWHWHTTQWVWYPGNWVVRPAHYRYWTGPRYFWRGNRVVYRHGYWRR